MEINNLLVYAHHSESFSRQLLATALDAASQCPIDQDG
jgi:putative NADPH-quinone reductase